MAARGGDPYRVLGVGPDASDADVRAAYRHLVQRYHPDHNGGSAESTRRFEEVQEAYARVKELRRTGEGVRAPGGAPPPGEDRLRDLERQVREAHLARERAREAARRAAAERAASGASERPPRPSDEELGYIKTDDSIGKILADARDELADRLSGAREHPVGKRITDLIDELEGLVSRDPEDRRRK
jgi:curved DNA-binding protein CbpA